jgi:hypothetical protein
MPTFGNSDIIQDQSGNALANVQIKVYGSVADAKSQSNLLATVTTNSKGQWPVTIDNLDMVWVGDPSGNIWSVASDTVAADHGARLATLEGAAGSYQTQASLDAATAALVNTAGSATRNAGYGVFGKLIVFDITDPRYGAVADCNGTQGNGTDNLAAFNAAFTAANAAKGRVYVPPGVYRCSGQLSVTYWLFGAGGGQPAIAGSAASTIVFDSGVSGVKMSGIASHLESIYLVGGGGTTNDGIKIENTWTVVRDVSVKGFSRHGYNLDSTTGVYDQAQVDTLHIYNCGGNGQNIVGGSDSNACKFVSVDCVGNTGWGIWNVNAARNLWLAGHLSGNTAGGIHDDGNSNEYHVYIEGGTGGTLDFGSTSSNGIYVGMAYAMPTMGGTGYNAAIQSWQIYKNGALKNQIAVEDAGATQTTKWGMRVGNYGAGWMELLNITSGTRLIRVDSTLAASYWNTHFRSETNATWDLGSSANGWRDVYANQLVRPSATKTTNYTLTSADNIVIFNGTSLTATLPDPTTAGLPGRIFMVKNVNSSALTVNSAGTSKTLDGAASQSLAQWGHASFTSDGTQWLTV